MTLRQIAWRGCYELLANRVRTPNWAFMNYGYARLSGDGPALELKPVDEADRLCIQR